MRKNIVQVICEWAYMRAVNALLKWMNKYAGDLIR